MIVFVVSAAGVFLVRRWTLAKGILDVPNERSSHSLPTPRGGGIVIACISLAAFVIYSTSAHSTISYGFVAGAVLVVAISWIDDLRGLPPFVRIAVHTVATAIVLIDRGPFPIFFGGQQAELSSVIEFGISLLFIVWLINAYNFMDGIDGIAGIQALAAAAGWCVLGVISGQVELAILASVIFASSLGFLVFNWQPAKIFMGDAGSAFLGFTFASIGLLAPNGSGIRTIGLPLACFLVWPFLFDSLYTLVRRLLRREKVWHAHRSHIYQQLVRRGYSHATVSIFYGFLALAGGVVAVTMPAIGQSLIPAWIAAAAICVILLGVELITAPRRISE
ncbi:MAG: glycosyltransferase family 4 protein [Acidobacteria bacterium]|nr:glycosyltransferase family 4 protein [Acidobacteriota bacterium]